MVRHDFSPRGLDVDEFLTAADWARAAADPPQGGADCFCVPIGQAGFHLSLLELDGEVIAAVRCLTCGGIRAVGT